MKMKKMDKVKKTQFTGIPLLISLLTILMLSGCTTPKPSENYSNGVAQEPLTILRGDYNSVILDFKVNRGSVGLYRNESYTNHSSPTMTLVHVESMVSTREGSGAQIEDALTPTYTEISSQVLKISFQDNSTEYLADYEYILQIYVCNFIILDVNISITSLGELNLDFTNPGLILTGFSVYTANGPIDGGIGSGLLLDPTPFIQTEEGEIDLSIGVTYNQSVTWTIKNPGIGGIDLVVSDDLFEASGSRYIIYNIEGNQNPVRIISSLLSETGLQINTTFSSEDGNGVVSIPGGGTTYTSSNFQSAAVKYSFIITVRNADITFIR